MDCREAVQNHGAASTKGLHAPARILALPDGNVRGAGAGHVVGEAAPREE